MSDEVQVGDYLIRRLAPPQAAGVTRLIRRIYGNSYHPRALYDPQAIVRLNRADQMASVVALDGKDEVVGHYALERPHQSAVAEASDALVDPVHRHHHLMEEMRLYLRREALRLGLVGVVGYAVTNHLYSQKSDEHIGAHPCGIALGLWPRSYHNMPEPLPQRMSFVLYYRFVRAARNAVHVVTHHQEWCAQVYRMQGASITPLPPAPAEGPGEIEVEYDAAVTSGTVRVRRVGADSRATLGQACRQLSAAGARAWTLELPLAQAGTADLCRAAEEEEGFFFCGVGPAFARDGDALLLQRVEEPIDPELLQIETAFARELLAYVVGERKRVGS